MHDWQSLQAQLPLLDDEHLSRMAHQLGEPVLIRLLRLFVSDGQSQGQALAHAFLEQDMAQMARCCHSLSSACGSYGALRCQFLSEKLELSCKQHNKVLIALQHQAWQSALAETLQLIDHRINKTY